ncbi:MAG: peptidoglycan editing factor PgeF [Acidobacteriota bacterium]|nr:peptidoglycan editing factor PgeF [Acidobacteriota bacterium]
MLRSSLLTELTWIEHGFGTRADVVSQKDMASLKQIHSAVVRAVDGAGVAGEGDALTTSQAQVPVSIRTADCYPILLADTRNLAVAAVHAGWRGTAAGIVVRTMEQMRERYGTDAANLRVAIGPGIGACCYRVGVEVARQFGLEQAEKIDLAEMNHRLLVENGVAAEHIDVLAGCTQCDAHLFHSFRREGERAGRMISWISRVL